MFTLFCICLVLLPSILTESYHPSSDNRFYNYGRGENVYRNFRERQDKNVYRYVYRDVIDTDNVYRDEKKDEEVDVFDALGQENEEEESCKRRAEYIYTKLDLELTTQTLQVMINFFEMNNDKLIADGLYGLRLTQGSLLYIIKHISKAHPLYRTILQLTKTITRVCVKGLEIIKAKSTKYDMKFLKVLDRPQYFFRSWRNADSALAWTGKKDDGMGGETFNEQKSDHCIGEILGSNADSKKKCIISKKCLAIEKRSNTQGYYLTHQTLYFIAADTHGCQPELVKVFGSKKALNKYYDTVGSNIYFQMEKEKFHSVSALDIFAEQGAICSLLGIVGCTQRNRLYEVMKFVDNNGCIRDEHSENKYRRVKRVDIDIDGCSQHTGAVVMSYLAMQLKFMVLPPPCNLLQ